MAVHRLERAFGYSTDPIHIARIAMSWEVYHLIKKQVLSFLLLPDLLTLGVLHNALLLTMPYLYWFGGQGTARDW